jgi:hypothetical protein
LYGLEIGPGGVIDRDFDAALKADVADPKKSRKRQAQNNAVQRREARADWEM